MSSEQSAAELAVSDGRKSTAALRDISITLHPGTPEWPGDAPFDCRWTARLSDGSSVNLSCIQGSPHVGTHADAPLHVAADGAPSDALPLEPFLGEAWVSDVRHLRGEVELDDLRMPNNVRRTRVLLRTGRSIAAGAFPDEWPVLSGDCVRALIARGLVLLGVDAPSVDARESKTLAVHHALFGGGAYVLENLDLREVDAGAYELVSLPIKLGGLDAAPVRAALRPTADARLA